MDTDAIRRIRELLFTGIDPWLAGCLHRYLQQAHKGLSLEAAFGLAVTRGEAPWWRAETLRARNSNLCALAQEIAPNVAVNKQAEAVHRMMCTYQGGRWRFDEFRDHIPLDYIGKRSELLYMTCRLSKDISLAVPGARQLRKILAPQSRPGGQKGVVK